MAAVPVVGQEAFFVALASGRRSEAVPEPRELEEEGEEAGETPALRGEEPVARPAVGGGDAGWTGAVRKLPTQGQSCRPAF